MSAEYWKYLICKKKNIYIKDYGEWVFCYPASEISVKGKSLELIIERNN